MKMLLAAPTISLLHGNNCLLLLLYPPPSPPPLLFRNSLSASFHPPPPPPPAAATRHLACRMSAMEKHSKLQFSLDVTSFNQPEDHQYENSALELKDKTDFATIVDNNGLISICGFGSLLSEKSARSTFPDLVNFRVGKLDNFRRVFAHVAPVFLERGIANVETKEISSLSVEPYHGESIVVTIFEIALSQVPAFIEREHEFRFLAVTPISLDGESFSQKAVVCSRYSDEEYRLLRCQGNDQEYHQRYGRYDISQVWRDDIFPCRLYLRHCVLAAKNLGVEAYDSFLDHTYLGDRRTTIRRYLALKPNIMEEEPPESLKSRYGG